jgi:hypothetical protein
MLRDAPRLYRVAKWAKDKPHLGRMVRDFDHLREKLRSAPVMNDCSESNCGAQVRWMTFPIAKNGDWGRGAYYWCKQHDPWRESRISEKVRVHFDAMENFKTDGDKHSVFFEVRRALGIKKGAKITEEFAYRFFSELD